VVVVKVDRSEVTGVVVDGEEVEVERSEVDGTRDVKTVDERSEDECTRDEETADGEAAGEETGEERRVLEKRLTEEGKTVVLMEDVDEGRERASEETAKQEIIMITNRVVDFEQDRIFLPECKQYRPLNKIRCVDISISIFDK